MSKITYVRLSEGQHEIIQRLVKDKKYKTQSDIIQEAISLWLKERGLFEGYNESFEKVEVST